jgi:hypothetical protein
MPHHTRLPNDWLTYAPCLCSTTPIADAQLWNSYYTSITAIDPKTERQRWRCAALAVHPHVLSWGNIKLWSSCCLHHRHHHHVLHATTTYLTVRTSASKAALSARLRRARAQMAWAASRPLRSPALPARACAQKTVDTQEMIRRYDAIN